MLHTFLGTGLEVGPGVLVPRAETELLGRTALSLIEDFAKPLVIDMCTGSGNVALAIAGMRTDAIVHGGDVTVECIDCARTNARRLGVEDRVHFEIGDMFGALDGYDLQGRTDLVVANPPYISSHKLETESAFLIESEPREAFDAGPYGISHHQRLIADAPAFLRPGGWLAMEFGMGQERQMKALFARARAFTDVGFHADAGGNPRVVVARRV